MVARSATPHAITADAVEFIRFCYARRRVGWPELYDEMCAAASRGLFRGWGSDELADHGIRFGLFDMPRLAASVNEIVAEDRARAKAAIVSPTAIVSPAAIAMPAAPAAPTLPTVTAAERGTAPRIPAPAVA